MVLQSDSKLGPSGTAIAAVTPGFMSTFRIPPVLLYYLLAAFCVVLVLYPVGILLLASVFKGQPGMLGEFTLAGYKTWLGAFDLIPIFVNSVIFASSRLAISLTFALLFAWAVARTDVPFRRTMTLLTKIGIRSNSPGCWESSR